MPTDFVNTQNTCKNHRPDDKGYPCVECAHHHSSKKKLKTVSKKSCGCDKVVLVKSSITWFPIEEAVIYQRLWGKFGLICTGVLVGVTFCHWMYVWCNMDQLTMRFLIFYSFISGAYNASIYFFLVVAIMVLLDSIDLGHLDFSHLPLILWHRFRVIFTGILHFGAFIIHLMLTRTENHLYSMASYSMYIEESKKMYGKNFTQYSTPKAKSELERELTRLGDDETKLWLDLSFVRFVTCLIAFVIMVITPEKDMLGIHLKNMKKYIPPQDNPVKLYVPSRKNVAETRF